jgi:hypothetical protein
MTAGTRKAAEPTDRSVRPDTFALVMALAIACVGMIGIAGGWVAYLRNDPENPVWLASGWLCGIWSLLLAILFLQLRKAVWGER